MLRAIKALFIEGNKIPDPPQSSMPSSPAGYFMPATVDQLLSPTSCKHCLQQLWENSALPKDLYEQFYSQPLKNLIALMQVLPAGQQGEYAREGGLVDITLQTTIFAVRLAKRYMLPPGATPEEQSIQNVMWNTVVFYAALYRYLPLFDLLEGELQSGKPWIPGLMVPSESYRFRFKTTPSESTLTNSYSAMIAARLLPAEAIFWLSALPAAIQVLMLIASGQPSPLPVIDDIVQEAVRLAQGDALLAALPISSPELSNVASEPITQSEPEQEPVHQKKPLVILDTDVAIAPGEKAFVAVTEQEQPGGQFWHWICNGLNTGEICINQVDARAHLVSGFAFITVPGIFYLHLKQSGQDGSKREVVQADFERLAKYRRSGKKRFYFVHLYESNVGIGPFKRVKGYLIKASLFYRGKAIPDDSAVLQITR